MSDQERGRILCSLFYIRLSTKVMILGKKIIIWQIIEAIAVIQTEPAAISLAFLAKG